MDERQFWLEVRRAALILVKAIEKRHGAGSQEQPQSHASERKEAASIGR